MVAIQKLHRATGHDLATRYDKLAANYLAFIKLASIRIWLRTNKSTPWFELNWSLRALVAFFIFAPMG